MGTDQQPAWVPATGVAVSDDLQPGFVKTLFRFDSTAVDDSDMFTVYADDLLAMGTAALAIDGDADQENLQAGKWQHQPGANRVEICGYRRTAKGKEKEQPLGLLPSQVSVWIDDENCFIRITVLTIR